MVHVPLIGFEKTVVPHAICCVIGFLGLLPAGAITARWTRTVTPIWFHAHWLIQAVLAGPIIIAGVALGIHAVNQAESGPLADTHKKLGIALFILYLAQVAGGLFIHFLKVRTYTIVGRSIQNYVHAFMGLLIISLAFYQARLGFRFEWFTQTGRNDNLHAAEVVWIVWVIVIPVFYFTGLLMLRRQYIQERAAIDKPQSIPDSETKTETNGH
ncbi:hypothetical protein CERSUDRAFT_126012 [Gelatoporia subvermispora B]|uniref:Cytochrome b561 domain-containing protein n=1 Tax=Ceriporiopsis subvermispora (strain B) TaxID=914234 RepID=M2QA31_CERS8|nr:hypothetical protein CERSUDRAFT_126012 [Gelatoporia subvermispora B]